MTREKTKSHHFDHHIKDIRDGHKLPAIIVTGLAVAAGVGITSTDNEPTPQPKTFEEYAQESAQKPYDPATDELVIGNIRVKPGNPNLNTPSEAIETAAAKYKIQNPSEAASIVISSNSVPSLETDTFAVVKRDIDDDGDTDAVAVQVIK